MYAWDGSARATARPRSAAPEVAVIGTVAAGAAAAESVDGSDLMPGSFWPGEDAEGAVASDRRADASARTAALSSVFVLVASDSNVREADLVGAGAVRGGMAAGSGCDSGSIELATSAPGTRTGVGLADGASAVGANGVGAKAIAASFLADWFVFVTDRSATDN